MKHIQAPNESTWNNNEKKIFLAGGCATEWRWELIQMLANTSLVFLDPKRDDACSKKEMVRWEHKHLLLTDAILFWFPKETLCPMTLYELGTWAQTRKNLFVGVHPDYAKREDVEIRLALADVEIVYSLEKLSKRIKWAFPEQCAWVEPSPIDPQWLIKLPESIPDGVERKKEIVHLEKLGAEGALELPQNFRILIPETKSCAYCHYFSGNSTRGGHCLRTAGDLYINMLDATLHCCDLWEKRNHD